MSIPFAELPEPTLEAIPNPPPRVAYCTDTFEEPNGVATVSRAFVQYARRRQLPLLLIRPGARRSVTRDGSITTVEVAKSGLCLPLDMGLRFDLLVHRQVDWLREQMNEFHPDLVHITGPGDLGMVCARLSHVLRVPKPPLVAAWHTNLHQYARLRAEKLLRWLPSGARRSLGGAIERQALDWASKFYKTARLILAPNEEILEELVKRTGKRGRLMRHGVDADLFSVPHERGSGCVTLGYAGRLTAEKNVRFLGEVAARLTEEQRNRVRFLIVGDGMERSWLERHLPANSTFTGILRGEELAEAYRKMDVFLFPSQSDTFGLVVLEAMSAGLPVVSFRVTGPNTVVEDGVNGYAVETSEEFVARVVTLIEQSALRDQLAAAARAHALSQSWEAVFASVYEGYREMLASLGTVAATAAEPPAAVPVH